VCVCMCMCVCVYIKSLPTGGPWEKPDLGKPRPKADDAASAKLLGSQFTCFTRTRLALLVLLVQKKTCRTTLRVQNCWVICLLALLVQSSNADG
jgi:hypothetical protein